MKTVLSFSFINLFLFSFNTFSQKPTGVIKGKILAADGNPAASVSVELKKLKRIIFTSENGYFILQHLPGLEDSLMISSVESEIYSREIKLKAGESVDLGVIRLAYNIKQLQQVEIAGRIAHSYKSDYSFLGTKTQTALKDIPQSISSVTKELIRDKMEFTLKDAIMDISGVNQYSGYDEYTIRGFRAENAHNINGLRGYNTTYANSMLVNIERIEVIKGPAATLYGNSDPGGTINLVTKKPLDKKETEIDIAAGSWDHLRGQGDITGPLNKNKTLLYRFNAGYDQTHSFRNQFFSKSYQLAPSLSFVPNDKIQLNLDFSLSHINTVLDRGQPGFKNSADLKATPVNLMVTQPGDYLHETDIASVLSFSYKINKHINFNSGYLNYITQQNVAEHGIKDYITPDSVYLYYNNWNYHTITNTFTNYFTFRFNTGKLSHQLLAGYDFISSEVRLNGWEGELPDQFGPDNGIVGTFSLKTPQYINRPVHTYEHDEADFANIDANSYSTQGIYIQEQLALNRWKLMIGLREEFYGADEDEDEDSSSNYADNIFLPRIGLVYAVTPDLSLYATYNKGFDPFEASATLQIFNAPFKPITSEMLEAGAKASFFRNKLSASLAVYQLTLQNVAVNANDPSNPDLYVQRGEDRARGIEAEANGNILPNLGINFSYAYNVAKIRKSEVHDEIGRIKENAPRHTSSSWVKYNFSKGALKGFAIAIGHSQVSIRNTLVNDIRLPEYFIMNAGIQYAYKHFSVALNANNLGNKTYWTSAYNNINKWPGAPRNYMISLRYKL